MAKIHEFEFGRGYNRQAMRAEIHPTWHADAVVHCLCGNTFRTGSTLPELKTEVCSVCHPFFTGQQRIVDTGGQVERFQKRLTKSRTALK